MVGIAGIVRRAFSLALTIGGGPWTGSSWLASETWNSISVSSPAKRPSAGTRSSTAYLPDFAEKGLVGAGCAPAERAASASRQAAAHMACFRINMIFPFLGTRLAEGREILPGCGCYQAAG